jgi:hypothetical protein
LRVVLRVELLAGRIDVGGIDAEELRVAGGLRLRQRVIRGRQHLGVDVRLDRRELGLGEVSLREQPLGKRRQRIAGGVRGTFLRRAVHPFIVRQRMRVWADDHRMDQRGAAPGARVRDRTRHRAITRDHVAPVDLLDVQPRERPHELRDRRTRGVDLHRHRDRVAIVLDEVHHRQLEIAGSAQRLPELAFAGRAVAGRDVHDFVLHEAVGDRKQLGPERGLCAPRRLQELRPRGRRRRDDVERAIPPVARHLPSPGSGIRRGTHRLIQHLRRRDAELEAERAVAVVGIEPVRRGPQHQTGRGQHRLVSGARDLEEDLVLALELDLLVIQPAGKQHRPVSRHELVAGQLRAGSRVVLGVRHCRHEASSG